MRVLPFVTCVVVLLASSVACRGRTAIDAPAAVSDAGPIGDVEVQVLAFNDFHGALDADEAQHFPGAAALAGSIAAVRTASSVTVAAGDNIGGSPLTSGLFHDEPTIEALDAVGLQYSAVGNHEYDEGPAELERIQHGGCHPDDGCVLDPTFAGASFHYLAANIVDHASGASPFPAFEIANVGGIPVAIVGVSTINTAATTVAAFLSGLDFLDEADSVNALVPQLQAAGALAIVVVIHEGGVQQSVGPPDPNGCDQLGGRIVDIVTRLDPAVTLVASGHSHATYNCTIAGHVVTSAGAHGQLFTDARLAFHDGVLQSTTATNIVVDAATPPDAAVAAIVQHAHDAAAPLANEVVGSITADLTRGSPESALGDVVADGMLAATSAAPANAQVALMNNGGLRSDLSFAPADGEIGDGVVRYAELFAVQPFANALVTVSVRGSDLVDVLDAAPAGRGPAMQIAGVSYVLHASGTPHVSDVLVAGAPIDVDALYRVTTNIILADPVSGYRQLADGADLVSDGVDLDALVAYFRANSPVAAPVPSRVVINP